MKRTNKARVGKILLGLAGAVLLGMNIANYNKLENLEKRTKRLEEAIEAHNSYSINEKLTLLNMKNLAEAVIAYRNDYGNLPGCVSEVEWYLSKVPTETARDIRKKILGDYILAKKIFNDRERAFLLYEFSRDTHRLEELVENKVDDLVAWKDLHPNQKLISQATEIKKEHEMQARPYSDLVASEKYKELRDNIYGTIDVRKIIGDLSNYEQLRDWIGENMAMKMNESESERIIARVSKDYCFTVKGEQGNAVPLQLRYLTEGNQVVIISAGRDGIVGGKNNFVLVIDAETNENKLYEKTAELYKKYYGRPAYGWFPLLP